MYFLLSRTIKFDTCLVYHALHERPLGLLACFSFQSNKISRINARHSSERVVNIWNSLLNSVDFSSVAHFKRTVKEVNFSKFVKYT